MSGRLFLDAEPIALYDYERVKQDIFDRLWDAGVERVVPVGTSGLKDVMGDIDLAVAHPEGRLGLAQALEKLFPVKKVGSDLASFEFTYTASVGVPFPKKVQVDCFVGNVDYIKWSRAGDTTPGVKAAARAVLWNDWLSVWSQRNLEESLRDSLDRERYVLDFGSGLYLSRQTRRGKRKDVIKEFRTLDRTFVTNEPRVITDMFFGSQWSVPTTFPYLVSMVKSDKELGHTVLDKARYELRGLCELHQGVYGDWASISRILNG